MTCGLPYFKQVSINSPYNLCQQDGIGFPLSVLLPKMRFKYIFMVLVLSRARWFINSFILTTSLLGSVSDVVRCCNWKVA